jgi:hypothetical protein
VRIEIGSRRKQRGTPRFLLIPFLRGVVSLACDFRRRGVARRAQGDREDLRLGAAGSRRRPLPRGAVRPRGGGGGGEVHLLRPQHDRRRARAFPGAQVPAVRRDAESAVRITALNFWQAATILNRDATMLGVFQHGRSAPGEAESREPACRRRSW